MKARSMNTAASVLLALSVANCSSDQQIDPAVVDYLRTSWGIQLSGFDGDIDVEDDGTQINDGTGTITVAGLGSANIASSTIISPMAEGCETTLTVSNIGGSDERYFLYDPVQNYITIGDYTRGVAVSKNPDSTYDVWVFDDSIKKDMDVTVPNGYEALKLVEQYNGFKAISPYILLTAFAFAHTPAPEARCGGYGWLQTTTASPQAVCDIFKEFCDCAACLVLNRRGACTQCPKL